MEVGDTFTDKFSAMVDLVGLLRLNRAQLSLLLGAFGAVRASTGRLCIGGKTTKLLGCNAELAPFFSMLGLEGHKGNGTFWLLELGPQLAWEDLEHSQSSNPHRPNGWACEIYGPNPSATKIESLFPFATQLAD